jgi:hypothetical protein
MEQPVGMMNALGVARDLGADKMRSQNRPSRSGR